MKLDLSLSNFRGFREQNYVPIRPITVLVGENSSGKTSFLAAVKFIHDLFNPGAEASFNADPFQLGTFEQIAHLRGGSAGRAKEFSIKARKLLTRTSKTNKGERYSVECEIWFSNLESAAAFKSLTFRTDANELKLTSPHSKTELSYLDDFGREHKLSDISPFTSVPVSEFPRFLPYIASEWRYGSRRKKDSDKSDEIPGLLKTIDRIESFVRSFSNTLIATSAIRTKPRRTYTPGLESVDAEGSHVPYEIAKLARRVNKTEWDNLRGKLIKFGQASEMFQDIHVKLLGRTASDPFQLQFSNNGPRMNIVDLGYGTSQVLPLLFSMGTESRATDFLIQQPEVHLHPKAQAALGQSFVDGLQEARHNFILETHSDFILDRIKGSVTRGNLKSSDVSIMFFQRHKLENSIHHLLLDDHGDIISPPTAYREFFLEEQLLSLGI